MVQIVDPANLARAVASGKSVSFNPGKALAEYDVISAQTQNTAPEPGIRKLVIASPSPPESNSLCEKESVSWMFQADRNLLLNHGVVLYSSGLFNCSYGRFLTAFDFQDSS